MLIKRRDFMRVGALGAAALAVGGCATTDSPRGTPSGGRQSAFRFAHLTDMHVRRRRKGDEGYRACIAHVNALMPGVDFVQTGGDLAFDGNYTDFDEFEDQVRLYKDISAQLNVPCHHCLGNHDGLGWGSRRKVPADHPEIGAAYIVKRLGMPGTYYSYDHKDWHFVVLDTMHQITTDSGPTYQPRIGDEQLHWLALDLGRAGDRPKVVTMHIAAFCNIGQIDGNPDAKAMTAGMVVTDNRALREILERHKVKAVLQGHSHRQEDFNYRGVNYLTSPAVSAAWWGGNWTGNPPGYTVFTCEGEILTWERVFYPWQYHLEPEDTLEAKKNEEWEAWQAEQARLLEEERMAGAALPSA